MKPPTFSGKPASQDAAELEQLLELFEMEGVRNYGEIGALLGDTFHTVMSSLPNGAKGVMLDLGEADNVPYIERAMADLSAQGYKVSCVWGQSKSSAARAMFHGRGPFDAIFIDADHRLEAVTADWEFARELGARIVAFHDITGPKPKKGRDPNRIQVGLLWRAIKQGRLYRTAEFVTPGSYQGIGVVWLR